MNKRFLLVLAAVLVLFAFGIASAGQIDGLRSFSGPGLPNSLRSYVNPGGVGDALIYNYYNTRNGMITYFNVVNTGEQIGNRVRIRFYEAADVVGQTECATDDRGSFEVLDFDICLSKGDMWSGWIQQDLVNGGAELCSIDDDTIVVTSDSPSAPVAPWAPSRNCVDFKFGAANIESAITADNTLEGYFVIIGEVEANPGFGSCGELGGTEVKNSLTGGVLMIDDTNSFAYNATAIADFSKDSLLGGIATKFPELGDGTNDLTGINFILTKADLFQVYDLLNGGATDYVLTAPTKKLTQLCGSTDMFDNVGASFTSWDDGADQNDGVRFFTMSAY